MFGMNTYIPDNQDLVWKIGKGDKPRLVIPRSVVPDPLALVHAQHGQPGVAGTTACSNSDSISHTIIVEAPETTCCHGAAGTASGLVASR